MSGPDDELLPSTPDVNVAPMPVIEVSPLIIICEVLDHADQKFSLVIRGVGNPSKPVYLCGCGRGIRVGQSIGSCELTPILTCIGAEP